MPKVQLSEVATLIRERPGPVRLVAVDGPGGSGKSTFAALLASELGNAPVVHTDDFASWDNPIDWWPRLLEQVIEPLSRATRARYQRYDWPTQSLAEWVDLDPAPVVVIEGVTSARMEWRDRLAFVVWIETPHGERLRRGLERDGADALDDWQTWGDAEDRHYSNDPTRRHADVVVDGTVPIEAGEFTTLAP
jgi:uridine kinase